MGVYSDYRKCGTNYYYNWVFRENRNLLHHYLDDVWEQIEHESIMKEFEEAPFIAFRVLQDFDSNLRDQFTNWYKMLDVIRQPGCEVIIISGSKRSGKTYDGWRILHSLRKEFEVYWVGAPVNLPDWCQYAPDVSYLPHGSVGLVDETAVFLNSRRAMSKQNMELLDHIPTMAHAGVKCIFITQSTARTDIALTGWADMHIRKQYKNVYGQSTERDIIRDRLDTYFDPPSKEWSYVKSNDFTGMYRGYTLDWYTDAISKPFSLFENKQMAMEYADALYGAGYDPKAIQLNMKLRGCKKDVKYWEKELKKFSA